jgi:hypothetical protein
LMLSEKCSGGRNCWLLRSWVWIPWSTWQIFAPNVLDLQSLGYNQMSPIILFVWTVTFSTDAT